MKVNKELFEKVFKENNGKCLCKIDVTCPCYDYIFNKECKCGVYLKDKRGRKKHE